MRAAVLWVAVLALPANGQTFLPPPGAAPVEQPLAADHLLPYTVVSRAEMEAWPLDKREGGEKRWSEIAYGDGGPDPRIIRFNSNIWPNRAVIEVRQAAPAATAEVWWRRSKLFARLKGLKLIDSRTGKEIPEAELETSDNERAVIRFHPASGAGRYYLYYGADEAGPRFKPTPAFRNASAVGAVPADVLRIEARSMLDDFWPMEVTATRTEIEALLGKHPGASYLIFPEDRHRPIKMPYDVPVHWAVNGPAPAMVLRADRNEYRVFQVGLWACRAGLANVKTAATALVSPAGGVIPAAAIQCLTLESRIRSRYIIRPAPDCDVPREQVRSLWFGIDVPEHVSPGEYRGSVTVTPGDASPATVPIHLTITEHTVADRGDHDLWRMARLRWLESDAGLSGKVYPPFTALRLDRDARTISTWGHAVALDATGLPAGIHVGGEEVLAEAFSFRGRREGRPVPWTARGFAFTEQAEDHVCWEGEAVAGEWKLAISGRMELDGIVVIDMKLAGPVEPRDDFSLTAVWGREHAGLASGLGYRGRREGDRTWRQVARSAACFAPQVWMGSVKAGLAFHTWDTAPWQDASRVDAMTVTDEGGGARLRLNLGTPGLGGKPWSMRFALQPTPVKPPERRHWQFRYVHRGGGFIPTDQDTPQSYLRDNCRRLDEIQALHARRLNLHDWWGPAFNCAWQWEGPDNLARLTGEAHRRGLFVKVYNSGRELSNLNPDFWGLLYVGTQYRFPTAINPAPRGPFQDAWGESHLPDGMPFGWPRLEGRCGNEHAFAVSNATRNGNYYLESMRYMTRHFGTDGAYWDGADGPTLGHREMARRLWTIFRETNPQATIDAHHGNTLLTSPVTDTMICFPFIDSIWHGEGFPYDTFDPWAWLVEVSGLPFNVPGEMLAGEQFLARGMLFGIWPRAGWCAGVEKPGRLWSFFDRFGIEEAAMRGFWDGPAGVTVDRPDTWCTVFTHSRKGVLVVVASWHPPLAAWLQSSLDTSLMLDRQRLGLPPGRLTAEDALSGEPIDVARPVRIDPAISGRLVWIHPG